MLNPLTDATFAASLSGIEAGAVLFYKKLCPHCKNMEKVLEKFAALAPEASLYCIDIEENPEAAAAHKAERAPTILVVKGGQVKGVKAGLMTPREMLVFYSASR